MDHWKLSILVVEDSPTCQAEFDRHLREWWYNDITILKDVPSAILRVRQRALDLIPYDLILCDYDLTSEVSSRTWQDLLEELRGKKLLPEESTFVMVSWILDYGKIAETKNIRPDGFCSKLDMKAKTNLDGCELENIILWALNRRRILIHVRKLLENKEYRKAHNICRAIIQREKKYAKEIETCFLFAKQKLEETKKVNTALREWEFLFFRQKSNEAIAKLQNIISLYPEHTKPYAVLSRIYEDINHEAEAQKTLESGLIHVRWEQDYRRQLAAISLTNGDLETSSAQFKEIIYSSQESSDCIPEDFVWFAKTMLLSWNIKGALQCEHSLGKRFESSKENIFCRTFIKMRIAQFEHDTNSYTEMYTELKRLFLIDTESLNLSENIQIAFMEEAFMNQDNYIGEAILKNLIKKTNRLLGLQNRIKKLTITQEGNSFMEQFFKEVSNELHRESVELFKKWQLSYAVKQAMQAVGKFEDEDTLKKWIMLLTASLRREWNIFHYRVMEIYLSKLEEIKNQNENNKIKTDIHIQTGAVNRIRKMYEIEIEAIGKNTIGKNLNKLHCEREQSRLVITEDSTIIKAREDELAFDTNPHIHAVVYRLDDKKTRYEAYVHDISDGGLSISYDLDQMDKPDIETHDQIVVEIFHSEKHYKTSLIITSAIQTPEKLLRMGGYYSELSGTNKTEMMELNALLCKEYKQETELV